MRKLQAFSVVAHLGNMTEAARQMKVAQPTLSQLVSGLESLIGTPLFLRTGSALVLTDAGEALLRKADAVLAGFDDFTATMDSVTTERPVQLRVAGVPSVMRLLLPRAVVQLRQTFPGATVDGHEQSPSDIVNLLYQRTAHLGILGANTVPEMSAAFTQMPLYTDPTVLVSPPDAPDDLPFLQVDLGSASSQRVAQWFARRFPRARSLMHLRSYETAVRFAEEGLGRCVAPLVSCLDSQRDTRAHVAVIDDLPPRRLVALIPQTHLRIPAYAGLVDTLAATARDVIEPVAAQLPHLDAR
ncbi:LysR family transcriptional regulator [Ketogulonicigenium robustum]|uniref:LysR family transcriptional regulator n=1 Tax=Ketogulonicigenium robustum TaxID=92947 RepID=UPI001F2ED788|nr:LysR family transcriptional regulator [Ketogulonicigenium robustum]